MGCRVLILYCAVAALAVEPSGIHAAPRLIPSPPSIWQAGDGWPLVVEFYPRAEKPATGGQPADEAKKQPLKPVRYDMHVVVTKWDKMTSPAWQVHFIVPKKDAPAEVGQRGWMILMKEDGAPRSAAREPFFSTVRTVEDIHVITNPPEGFPVDVFFAPMDYDQNEFHEADASLTLKKQVVDKRIILEATYQPAKGDALMVRQTWLPGEKWWREFERYRGGRKELHAWVPPEHFAKQAERRKAEAAAAPGSSLPPGTPGPSPPAAPKPTTTPREDERELRDDPRLRVLMDLQLKRPTVEEVLRRLRTATKVELNLDPAIDGDGLAFGSYSARGVPAWRVMIELAMRPAIAGRWERTETGYQLSGPPKPPSGGTGFSLRWWLTAVIAVSILGVSAWLAVRSLRKRASPGRG